jgi:hypothetical protein
MKLTSLIDLKNGTLLVERTNLELDIQGGYGPDQMSDRLASCQPDSVLLTGPVNPQAIRTALMADLPAIIFARGKCPPQETLDLACRENFPQISSRHGMFELCGRLYQAGLPSLEMDFS